MTSQTRTTTPRTRLGRLFGRGPSTDDVVEVGAPVPGRLRSLESLGDGVFSAGLLGVGIGVVPDSDEIVAPVDGEVVSAMPHAYGIRTPTGIDVLVHVGIDTVELDGGPFSPQVRQQQRVRRGDPLVAVSRGAVSAAGYDPTVVVLVTNSAEWTAVVPSTASSVSADESLIAVTR